FPSTGSPPTTVKAGRATRLGKSRRRRSRRQSRSTPTWRCWLTTMTVSSPATPTTSGLCCRRRRPRPGPSAADRPDRRNPSPGASPGTATSPTRSGPRHGQCLYHPTFCRAPSERLPWWVWETGAGKSICRRVRFGCRRRGGDDRPGRRPRPAGRRGPPAGPPGRAASRRAADARRLRDRAARWTRCGAIAPDGGSTIRFRPWFRPRQPPRGPRSPETPGGIRRSHPVNGDHAQA
ncbi:MAG: hypothetical protein QOE80_1605, partial [Actinomycetota bacterium]|nr:hypothetical protein [Actinomycetota bacterium]